MNTPANLRYTKEHEWIRIEGNIAFVGITDFAQDELGDVVFVEVNNVGKKIKKGDAFGSIEAMKAVSDLFLPVSGKILEMNKTVENKPKTINEDPYNEGWIAKIEIEDKAELDDLLSAKEYKSLIS